MNSIHGRYFIHNDGMKYVLLNAAFTILDGLDVIGHRPLAEKERLGYFHAQIHMGQAMNIQGLSHSWHEMYGWFCDLNRKFSKLRPAKKEGMARHRECLRPRCRHAQALEPASQAPRDSGDG